MRLQYLAPTVLLCVLVPGVVSAQSQVPAVAVTVDVASLPNITAAPEIRPLGATVAGFRAWDEGSVSRPASVRGAIGNAHVVSVTNSIINVQTKSGASVLAVTLESFWAPAGVANVHHPNIVYDPYGARWIMTASSDPETNASSALFAVSASDDPTGLWYLRAIDVNPSGFYWAGNSFVGFSRKWIAVSVRLVNSNTSCCSGVGNSALYIWNKADFYANIAATATNVTPNSSFNGTAATPAITYDPNLDDVYFVDEAPPYRNYTKQLYLIKYTAGGVLQWVTAPQFPVGWMARPQFRSLFRQNPAPAATAPNIASDGIDSWAMQAIDSVVYRNGYVWGAHTVYLPARPVHTGDPTGDLAVYSAVQWFQLTTAGSVAQTGRIVDTTGNTSYADGSITVNAREDVLLGYSRFSASEYASAGYAYRGGADPVGTLTLGTAKAGEARYTKTDATGLVEWGPQGSTAVDPTDDRVMWTVQQYAAALSFDGTPNRMSAWWSQVQVDGPDIAVTRLQPDGPLPTDAGVTTTWTAEAYSAVGPVEYRFWLYDGVTGAWQIVQDYSSDNTYSVTWQPEQAGPAVLQVWVRRVGSTASYEAWKSSGTFTIYSPSARMLSFSASPAGDVTPGATITFTATARSFPRFGGVPTYKFWLYDVTSGVWRVLRDYTADNTFSWVTSSADAGRYVAQVWVRAGSAQFDDWRSTEPFSVLSASPVVRGIQSNVGFSVQRGTPLTFTALAGGGTSPLEYEFWRYDWPPGAAGGTWTLVQPYGGSNRYNWTPLDADLGIHMIQVWVRQTGSSASYEAFGSTDYFRITPLPPPYAAGLSRDVIQGNSLQFTAYAYADSGGTPGSFEYRFFLYNAATNTRTIVQDYSTNNKWTWTPVYPADAGYHQVEVWVRNVGSPLDLEIWMITEMFLL
jgi:hypothetical protein